MNPIVLIASVILAQAQPQTCAPAHQVLETINQALPITQSIKLDREQTAKAVNWFNNYPPGSKDEYNFAIILRHEGGRVGLLVGVDGNVCAMLGLKRDDVQGLLDVISGSGA